MPVPHVSGNFADLLDPRFQEIFEDKYNEHPDMVPTFFGMEGTNGRDVMTWSEVGTLPNFTEFTGSIDYSSQSQGFDSSLRPIEFANGFQIERPLFDDDQFGIMDGKPRHLAKSAFRTRQVHAAQPFNNAFAVDTTFGSPPEAANGVGLCSNSHTNTTGASTAVGYDNLITTGLSAVGVFAARLLMRKFRDDQANPIEVMPSHLIVPVDLEEIAWEIVNSAGKVGTTSNNANFHQGSLEVIPWIRLTSTSNWFLTDMSAQKENLKWSDRIALEFGAMEDFDTLVAKFRAYMRYGFQFVDWRWVVGSQVS